MIFLQKSRPKVAGTLEQDGASPLISVGKYRFFPTQSEKSPDYQHCKCGEGITCLVFQDFCPELQSRPKVVDC